MSKKKYRVVSLGCRTNQYESNAFRHQLHSIGFDVAEQAEEADLCIVNTCTVTASADSHSRHAIRKLIRENPDAKVVVTGCMVENKPDLIKEIPGISKVVSNLEKESLMDQVFPDEEIPEFQISDFDGRTRAYVKVQDGCNSFCTYCTIPYVRGRSRSRSIPPILEEIKSLVARGFREVVLTGINIGDFDGAKEKGEKPDTLADLIREVDQIEGLDRIRVSSIDPDEVDDDLLDAIVNGKKTCHSMHIVLQSGSNVVLKRMNRKYTRQMFFETVERLRKASPDFTFTTDVIVGFPGETEQDFAETMEAVESVRFVKVHMFPYSDRERTRAARYPNKVPSEIMKKRKQILLRRAEEMGFEERNKFVGQEREVLLENRDSDDSTLIWGHTDNMLAVCLKSDVLKENDLVRVKLVENTPKGFIGQLV